MSEFSSINVKDVKNFKEKINIIDIRSKSDYDKGTIEGAKNISANELRTNPEIYLNKEETYYILCRSGNTSASVCKILAEKGYKVVNLTGGYMTYKR